MIVMLLSCNITFNKKRDNHTYSKQHTRTYYKRQQFEATLIEKVTEASVQFKVPAGKISK